MTTSLKAGADFKKERPKPTPTFKLGLRRNEENPAHQRPFKKD
jgi:hypothetical protein